MRLDKLLSHSGFGTRKTVKQLLKKKVVRLDHTIITKGDYHVDPDLDVVTVHGEEIQYKATVYLMLHKPPNYISATTDNRAKTVIDLVPEEFKHHHLFPVGRLDKDTEGLLLLTNDGQLNHQLTNPKKDIFKTYFAKIDGIVEEKHIEQFNEGIILDDGYQSKPAYLKILKSNTISEIELSISEGKFHQVKRMFQSVGMEVIYLKRIQMGEITLDKTLSIGKMRLLNPGELAYLKTLK